MVSVPQIPEVSVQASSVFSHGSVRWNHTSTEYFPVRKAARHSQVGVTYANISPTVGPNPCPAPQKI